jgi:SAM-dependent methyltransferase
MANVKDVLGHFSGSKVLDVATGSGSFIHLLLEGLRGWTEITGIDTSERAQTAFTEAFKGQKKIHFVKMDASKLDFADASFDTVCIANSLHHMPDPSVVLAEMKRVLKPGGRFVIFEMCRDGQTKTQMTHVLMHDWWGLIDSAEGICHRATYSRQEILALLEQLNLVDVQVHDIHALGEDPLDPAILAQLGPVIDRYQERASRLSNAAMLCARGEELRKRIKTIGFHSATELLLTGKK